MISHQIMAGKVHVYLRDTSPVWQCATFVNRLLVSIHNNLLQFRIMELGQNIR